MKNFGQNIYKYLFDFQCKKCGSKNVKVEECENYDDDDLYVGSEIYLECRNCGSYERLRGE